jgi:ribosomal protein L11 methyltransferase
MLWYELKVDVRREDSEMVAEIFRENGLDGVAFCGSAMYYDAKDSRPLDQFDVDGEEYCGNPDELLVTIKAYVAEEQHKDDVISSIKAALLSYYESPLPELVVSAVDSEDWGSSWKKYYKPEKIGSRVVIVPKWETYHKEPNEVIVELDPGEAFGTGQHGTTKGAILAMTEHISRKRVLDVGCGSGILSIVAAKLGASKVVGIDIDPVAVKVAIENVESNGVQNDVSIQEGDLLNQASGEYDVIVANIFKDVIIRLLPDLNKVSSSFIFICSGFVTKFEEEVKQELIKYGHRVIGRYEIEDWVTLVSEVSEDA